MAAAAEASGEDASNNSKINKFFLDFLSLFPHLYPRNRTELSGTGSSTVAVVAAAAAAGCRRRPCCGRGWRRRRRCCGRRRRRRRPRRSQKNTRRTVAAAGPGKLKQETPLNVIAHRHKKYFWQIKNFVERKMSLSNKRFFLT